MMENVVDLLEGRRFITRHIHPAYILITQEGINVCSRGQMACNIILQVMKHYM
jgi:hypothetical protein